MTHKPTQGSRTERVLQFLLELAALRARAIRRVDQYERALWFGSLPKEASLFVRAWSGADGLEDEDDVWLRIRKKEPPRLPPVPAQCEPWLPAAGVEESAKEPALASRILAPPDPSIEAGGATAGARGDLLLSDHPSVSAAWAQYLERDWRPWAEVHKAWRRHQDVYAELFGIYQDLQREGETYELVLGLGLLSWRSTAGEPISRHLVVARAELQFEAERGVFTVRAATAGTRLSVELDMLDLAQRPQQGAGHAEELLRGAEDDPWRRGPIDATLSALSSMLSDRGTYEPQTFDESSGGTATPIVRFAPALILRKRSTRGVSEFLKRLLEKVREGAVLPDLWTTVTEEAATDGAEAPERSAPQGHGQSEEPLFPLASNEEQREILSRLSGRRGVVVQGPPGTGKSHTIANLLCHLLASGGRVLVTAQTPRALQVLHEKLPTEIRPLCVSILGTGAPDQKAIQESVHRIVEKRDRWSEMRTRGRIAETETTLASSRRDVAALTARLAKARESDAIRHRVAGGEYEGTSAQIAERVAEERAHLGWIPDRVSPDASSPLTVGEIVSLRQTQLSVSPLRRSVLSAPRPTKGELPSIGDFSEWVRSEEAAADEVERSGASLAASRLCGLADADFEEVRAQVRESATRVDGVRALGIAWSGDALADALRGQGGPWEARLRVAEERTKDLADQAQEVEEAWIDLPPSPPPDVLLRDAEDLLRHLEAGGKKGLIPFLRPEVVKRTQYIERSIRVRGGPCSTPASLRSLVAQLSFMKSLELAEGAWTPLVPRGEQTAGPILRVSRLEEQRDTLRKALETARQVAQLRGLLAKLGLADAWDWHALDVGVACQRDLDRAAAARSLARAKSRLARLESSLRVYARPQESDGVGAELLRAVRERSEGEYAECLRTLEELESGQQALRRSDEYGQRLGNVAPRLLALLQDTTSDPTWEDRLPRFAAAWAWARAAAWVDGTLSDEDRSKAAARREQLLSQARRAVELLAAERAWLACFSKMTDAHRASLVGWQQAFQKIGKGTGKHAGHHRREAQRHLEACRDAIPAWVMPLHTVFDTVDPRPGMFDVVIIDEASQCGPDAMPLFLLGRRMVVVGDDKQISPVAVGVDRDDVLQLLREYLSDLHHGDAFQVDSSLFDQAIRRFGNRILLREHFRCMPEIIEFSNRAYYGGHLQALRQHGADRLEPLRAVLVSNGHREGSQQSVFNMPEATVLVSKLLACHRDVRYAGKTFGVIVLQGNGQARRIERMLLELLGPKDFQARHLLVGDPYVFQGDERDVMFMSLVAAPNADHGALTTDVHHRRFNVAASRARDQLWLFHSVRPDDLSPTCVRRKLLEHFLVVPEHQAPADGLDLEGLELALRRGPLLGLAPPPPFDSWFEVKVFLKIARRGYRITPQVEKGEYRMDMVIDGAKGQLAIECDGDAWHGPERFELDLARQAKLERSGWSFFRVRGCEFAADPDRALLPLWEELQRRGIDPGWTTRAWACAESMSSDQIALKAQTGGDSSERLRSTEVRNLTGASPGGSGSIAREAERASPADALGDARTADDGPPPRRPVRPPEQLPLLRLEEPVSSLLGTSAGEETSLRNAVALQPYIDWPPRTLPDPRSASPREMAGAVEEIVAAEGPVTASRIFRVYLSAGEPRRLGRQIRAALWRGLKSAVSSGRVVQVELPPKLRDPLSATFRTAQQSEVVPRTAATRYLNEVPPSELLEVMTRVNSQARPTFTEDLFREVAVMYGRRRVRASVRSYLEEIWERRSSGPSRKSDP